MSETLLHKARNIHEQQTHNRRMTVIFILLFMIFFLSIGIGFDIFYGISRAKLIFILPLFALTFAPILSKARQGYFASAFEDKKIEPEIDPNDMMIKFVIGLFICAGLFILWFAWNFQLWSGVRLHGIILYFDYVMKFLDEPFLRIMPWGTFLTIIIVVFFVVTSLKWGPISIVWSVEKTTSSQFSQQQKLLQNVIKEMSLAAGIMPPDGVIINDSDPNAFAVGTKPENSSIVVTSGLLSVLTREELQGVIAHEISHIRNNDTQVMTVVTVLFGGILLLAEWMRRIVFWNVPIGSKIPGVSFVIKTILFLFWLLAVIFSPLIARILAMSVSRQREYLADASGAELTRNPLALASALSKIESQPEPTRSIPKSIAHFCVIDPLGRRVNNKEGFWADLFATHPPIQKRIMFLRAMAYQNPIPTK